MERKHARFLLFLTFVSLQVERSVTCRWDGSIQIAGQCYLLNSTKLSYMDAKRACELKDGVLAKVTEKSTMKDVLGDLSVRSAWIGANDLNETGTWVWEYGGDNATELSHLWGIGEPSNLFGTEDCARIFSYFDGQSQSDVFVMDATKCDTSSAFVCLEKDLTTTAEPATSTSTSSDTTTTTSNIEASTSTSKVPLNTWMKCGANFPSFNVLLFLNLFAFTYLFI